MVTGAVTRHTTALPPPPAAHRVSARAVASACPCSLCPSWHSLCQGTPGAVTPRAWGTSHCPETRGFGGKEPRLGLSPGSSPSAYPHLDLVSLNPEAGADQAMHGNNFHVSHEQLTCPGGWILSLL